MTILAPTEHSRLRRRAQRGSYDRATLDPILDEALVAHVGFASEGRPVVLPMAFVRLADRLYFHGARANRMLGALLAGAEVCVTVTLLDGLVLARSAFHHSMNYRSVMLFGTAVEVTDITEKNAAFRALVDKTASDRSTQVRGPDAHEHAATLLVSFLIVEGAAKVRTGPPVDDARDMEATCWAGVIPLRLQAGTPEAAPRVAGSHPDSPRGES